MSLRIYDNVSGSATPFSVDAVFTNPISFSFDGRVGGVLEMLLYVRNTDVLYRYEDLEVTVAQTSGSLDLIGGTQGFSFKLKSGDTRPSDEEWATISAANTISLEDIPDTVTYLPFWLRIEVPRQIPVQRFHGVSLKTLATQILV